MVDLMVCVYGGWSTVAFELIVYFDVDCVVC